MVFELIRSAEASASLHSRICFQNLYAPSVSHPNLNLCIHNTIIDSGVQPVQAIDLMLSVFIHSDQPRTTQYPSRMLASMPWLPMCFDRNIAAFQGSRYQWAGMMCRVAPSRTGSTFLTAMTSSKTWSTSSSKGGSLYVTYMPLRILLTWRISAISCAKDIWRRDNAIDNELYAD